MRIFDDSRPLAITLLMIMACVLDACSGGGSSEKSVVINEVNVHGRDWIELVNTDPEQDLHLGGWILSDSIENAQHHHALPAGTVIEPGQHMVVKQADSELGEAGFSFGIKSGDTVFLVTLDGDVVAQVTIGEVPAGSTWGRYPDQMGEWGPTEPTQGAPNQPATTPAPDISFDPAHMLTVHIEMEPTDWQALKDDDRFKEGGQEAREGGFFDYACEEPWPNHYDWFEASVTIDGVKLERVGIRKKGFVGSTFGANPALKLKTDKFVDGQYFGDTERITLNNNSGDPTSMKTCLTLSIFAAAGYPAPRCNLADVWVNGEHLGAYTHVEAVKKRFLDRAFGDTGGSLYEGTHTDFVEGWLPRWEVKTSDTDDTRAPLMAVAKALDVPDDQLLAALEQVVNLERYYTFWALEALVNHTDGYAADHSNFYVHFDPADDGRATFLPWGVDKTLYEDTNPLDVYLNAHLPRRLSRIPSSNAAMAAELKRLAAEVWDSEVLLEAVDRFEVQLEAVGSASTSDIQMLRAFLEGRPAQIQALLANGLGQGGEELSECDAYYKADVEIPHGGTYDLSGSFKTTFGTLESGDPFSKGSGTFSLSTDGHQTPFVEVGSEAGASEKETDQIELAIVGRVDGDTTVSVFFGVLADEFVAGGSPSCLFGFIVVENALLPKEPTYGFLDSCTLTLSAAGATPGDPVEGTFSAWSEEDKEEDKNEDK